MIDSINPKFLTITHRRHDHVASDAPGCKGNEVIKPNQGQPPRIGKSFAASSLSEEHVGSAQTFCPQMHGTTDPAAARRIAPYAGSFTGTACVAK